MAYSAKPFQVNWQNLSCKALFWNSLILQALVGKTFQRNPPTPQPGRARRRAKPEHGTIRFVIMCPRQLQDLFLSYVFPNGWQYILVWNCCCRWPELWPQGDGLPRTVVGCAEQTNHYSHNSLPRYGHNYDGGDHLSRLVGRHPVDGGHSVANVGQVGGEVRVCVREASSHNFFPFLKHI